MNTLLKLLNLPESAAPVIERTRLQIRSGLINFGRVLDDTIEQMAEVVPGERPVGQLRRDARRLVEALAARQQDEEKSWGEAPTDVDRLLRAAASLRSEQILFLEDHSVDQRSGHGDARAIIQHDHNPMLVRGYVFYTRQDLEAAVEHSKLWLGFGGWGFTGTDTVLFALIGALHEAGLAFEASGVSTRVDVHIDWRRRGWATGELYG